MLCQFTVKNFKSIRDEMTFDMQAAGISEHNDRLLKEADGQAFVPVSAIYGPNGGGKSTLARCIMQMYPLTGGEIRFFNENKNTNWKQMIFQDSASALNPRMTVGQIIAEPIRIAEGRKPSRERIIELMRQVELEPELIDRHPYEISGGQRQRAAIARAISGDPELIIADEPISSLDISTQAQIVHLFRRLQEERNLTIFFIAHDLPMVNHISDRIIEM